MVKRISMNPEVVGWVHQYEGCYYFEYYKAAEYKVLKKFNSYVSKMLANT